MASIRIRTASDGERRFAVLYRDGDRQASKTFTTEREARKLRDLLEHLPPAQAIAALGGGPLAPASLTIREVFDMWIERKRGDVTPRVARDYVRNYENWIDPFFGHRDAVDVTELDVQNWVDKHLAPRLSPKTTADHHALLNGMLSWASARKRALIPHNPCTETDLPKKVRTSPKGLTLPEWLALRDAAYRVDADAADLILFLASTGWRIGEATALMVRGIEDDGARMYAEMTQVNRKGDGVVAGGKSTAALRRIRMLPECAAMLRRRSVGLKPGDLVFTNPHAAGGLWETSTFRRSWWRRSVAEAGLAERAPTPHWLRHTHVMLCVAAGMSLPEIQRRLGHEDIKTTINTYGRLIDDMSDDVANRLALLVSPTPEVVSVVRGELA